LALDSEQQRSCGLDPGIARGIEDYESRKVASSSETWKVA